MKRWLQVLSRVGTVLVAVGLAFLLVSLIPPARTMSFSSGNSVQPESFANLGPVIPPFFSGNATFYSQFFSTLTPQQELKVDFTCNGTVDVYLLKISMGDLMTNFTSSGFNVTALKDYLDAKPSLIAWRGTIAQRGTLDYTPTDIINATVVMSNPSGNTVTVDYDGSILNMLGPADKVRTLAYVAIPVGFVLAIPWILSFRKKSPSNTTGNILPQNAA